MVRGMVGWGEGGGADFRGFWKYCCCNEGLDWNGGQ